MKNLEKEKQSIYKARRKIIKTRTEINEIENGKKISKIKIWFFENINKINKPLAKLTKKKGHKIPVLRMKHEISLQTLQTLTG